MNKSSFESIINSYQDSFGIYLHIPFCEKKCSYCDFYSITGNKELISKYIKALKKEIKLYAKELSLKEVRTIYFGGGTPSLLTPHMLEEIMTVIKQNFQLHEGIEVTLESNPSSLNSNKLSEYNKLGINRLSIGVQSFSNDELKMLGRLHNAVNAREIISKASSIYDNFNLDFIFALPGQNLAQWRRHLQTALEYTPPHLSIYNLQIEEGTPLKERIDNGQLIPLNDEIDAEMYKLTRQILHDAGYNQYEISNFAKTGYQSQHNLLYWKLKPYIGLGPAAHSFTGEYRYNNVCNLKDYLDNLNRDQFPVNKKISLTLKELMAEKMFMGLRLLEGVSKENFYHLFNIKLKEVYGTEVNDLKNQGLLEEYENNIKLTDRGLLLGNKVFIKFL